jgi:hypothetical protein
MKTAGELLAEVQLLRDLERGISDPQVLTELRALIAELEARARQMEDGV